MPPFKTKTCFATPASLAAKIGGALSGQSAAAGTVQIYSVNNVAGDHLVPRGIVDKSSVDILNRELGEFRRHSKLCVAGSDHVLEGRRLGHRPGAHVEPHGATLHINDRMVSVFPRRSRGQADNIPGLHLPHHPFEGERGKVVAFVDDNMPVLGNEILDLLICDGGSGSLQHQFGQSAYFYRRRPARWIISRQFQETSLVAHAIGQGVVGDEPRQERAHSELQSTARRRQSLPKAVGAHRIPSSCVISAPRLVFEMLAEASLKVYID